MDKFEKYLTDFNSSIDIWEFVINLVVVTVLAYICKLFYVNYGKAVSNRSKFSSTFLPLALSTLLIITVIKSSISLSLGLVGALSIVRFRAAIKDPEELIYLFLMIGLGVTGGANKPILAIVSFAFILPLLYLNHRSSREGHKAPTQGKSYLNIRSSQDVSALAEVIKPHVETLDLRRYDKRSGGDMISFLVEVSDVSKLSQIMKSIRNIDAGSEISFVDQPDVAL